MFLICKEIYAKIKKIVSKDLCEIIYNGYMNIDGIYRASFWAIFFVICFSFGFHTINFMWGNHDWDILVKSPCITRDFGRYSLVFLRTILGVHPLLPFLYDILSFLALAFSAVLVCIYFALPKKISFFFLSGLILVIQPFTLSSFYYQKDLPETFLGPIYAILGLQIFEKVFYPLNGSLSIRLNNLSLTYIIFGIFLIVLTLSTYPVQVNTLGVLFFGKCLISLLDRKYTYNIFLKKYFLIGCCLLVSLTVYYFLVFFLFPVRVNYNTSLIDISSIFTRLPLVIYDAFLQLYSYPYPFISDVAIKLIFSFFIICCIYFLFFLRRIFFEKVLIIGFFILALFSTKISGIIGKNYEIDARIELWGLVYFHTLITILILKYFPKIKNYMYVSTFFIICISIINDLDCLRCWKLGFEAEKMFWNRVLSRLEADENFYLGKMYKVIQIGPPISLRKNYASEYMKNYHNMAYNMLGFSYDPAWSVFRAYEFWYPERFVSFTTKFDNIFDETYQRSLYKLFQAGILSKASVWPSNNGLIVFDDCILFVTDQKSLDKIRLEMAKRSF